jgi:hypothetical protein
MNFDFPEELLSAYLDGELSEREVAQIDLRLEQDAALRLALAELRVLRTQTASFLREADTGVELNLWAAIEKQLPVKQAASSAPQAFLDGLKGLFAQPMGVALAGAFGLAMFALGNFSSQLGEDTRMARQADRNEVLVPIIQDARQLSGEIQYVSNPAIGFAPRFVSPQTLREDHPARSAGYRAEALEIEWMKCPGEVKLVRSKERNLPPVLWIGERTR